ncbi:MAG: FtsX-like permease family protein, partial [Halobacteriota archaeon]
PRSTVESRAGVTSQQVFDEDLPLALSVTAFLIAVVVGTLFVMTMTGLEVTADRVRLGTLAAIGISGSSRLWLLSVQTVLSTLLGGIVGIGLGFVGILAVNEISAAYLTVVSVAASDPLLFPYGLAVSLVIALLSLPYLVVLLRRVGTVAEVLR